MSVLGEKFLRKLSKCSGVEQIILYGSRARGDNRARSDIDLAIVCATASSAQDWQEIVAIVDSADTLLNIDCIKYNDLANDNPLRQEIDRDGVFLYKKDKMDKIKLAFDLTGKAIGSLKQMVAISMRASSVLNLLLSYFGNFCAESWRLKGRRRFIPKMYCEPHLQGC